MDNRWLITIGVRANGGLLCGCVSGAGLGFRLAVVFAGTAYP